MYHFAQYGASRVAMVANHNTLGLRAAIGGVAKVYGMSVAEMNRLMPYLVWQTDFRHPVPDLPAGAWVENLCRTVQLTNPWPEILRLAVRLLRFA